MTIARAQAHELLATPELAKVRDYLNGADLIVKDVQSLFFNVGDFAAAARLKDIQRRLVDEIQALERRIAASKPTFCH